MEHIKKLLNDYLFTVIAIIVAIILAYLYLKGEQLILQNGINHEKLTNYFITLFTVIGTISAVYYAYKQSVISKKQLELLERQLQLTDNQLLLNQKQVDISDKQLELTNQQVEISDKHFKLTEKEALSSINPAISINREHWFKVLPDNSIISTRKNSLECPKAVHMNKLEDYTLEISNHGYGAAKDIHIKWQFDQDKAKGLIDGCYYIPFEEGDSFDILKRSKKEFFKLPALYVACCGVKVLKKYKIDSLSNRTRSGLKLPKLKLIISYTDMHGTPFSSNYEFFIASYPEGVHIV